MWILKSAQAAFGSWTMVAGMLIGGITLFNFLQRAFQLGLHEVFERILSAYRAVFHTLFDWLTFWMPFDFAPWMKDVAVVWFVLWGAMARILWLIYSAEMRERGNRDAILSTEIPILGFPMERGRAVAALCFVASIVVWPLILLILAVRKPHFATYREGGFHAAKTRQDNYQFDIRFLYLVQLAMMAVVAGATIVTNDIIT